MGRGRAVAIALAMLLVVSASACGEELSSEIAPDTSSANDAGAGGDVLSPDGQTNGSADGSTVGNTDGATPVDASAEAGSDGASGGPTWKCSNKTREYQNLTSCQNAHDLLCQPTKAGVDEGLPCPSVGEVYITCGACNAQNDFNARDCLCVP